jgi:hypothetical protein
MKVAIVTSVSSKIAEMAATTAHNKVEYCLRHGYSLLLENRAYADAVKNVAEVVLPLLDRFDLVWTLDADCVITNMGVALHELGCLGPGATVCEEGIVGWNKLNCGSIVWRAGERSQRLLRLLHDSYDQWVNLPCQWQTWMAGIGEDLVTVAPLRAFNSCAWNAPGGGPGEVGTHWHPGDFVYHPCGVFPMATRVSSVKAILAGGVAR